MIRRNMRGERNTNRNVRKFIRILDMEIWDKIDEIMTLPEYEKSFNKVINEALFYGMDTLHKQLFFKEEFENEVSLKQKEESVKEIEKEREILSQIIRLLKEMIVNETINKSILCSLFQVKNLELNHKTISGQKFEDGFYRDTPNYLVHYELKALKDLKK